VKIIGDDLPPLRVTLHGTKGSATLELVPRWWFRWYLFGLAVACWITSRDPDETRVLHWLNKAARWKIVHIDTELTA
jgi:hypothetical protein